MSERQSKRELWLRAKARMDRVASFDRFRVLKEEIENAGLTEVEAIRRVVEDMLGKNAKEDQVKDLATAFAWVFGMKPDRFVLLWRGDADNR